MRKFSLSLAALLLTAPAAAQPPVEAEISEKSAREDIFPQAEVGFPGDVVAARGAYQMHLALKNQAGGGVDPHAGHSH